MQEHERGLGAGDLLVSSSASPHPPHRGGRRSQRLQPTTARPARRPQRRARSPSARIAASSSVEIGVKAARAEADVPALVAQHELGALAQPGQPVVEPLEQRVLAGGEHHALEDHVVEPDRLARRLRAATCGSRTSKQLAGTRRRHARADRRADRVGVAGEEARMALLVALLGSKHAAAAPSRTAPRCSATPASPTQKPATSSVSALAGASRPGAASAPRSISRLVPLRPAARGAGSARSPRSRVGPYHRGHARAP